MDPDNLIETNDKIYSFVTDYLTGLWSFVNNFTGNSDSIDSDVTNSLLSFTKNGKYFDLVVVKGFLYCWHYRNVFERDKAIFIADEGDKGLLYPTVKNPVPVFVSRKVYLSNSLFIPVNSVRWRLTKIVYGYVERGSVRSKTIYL